MIAHGQEDACIDAAGAKADTPVRVVRVITRSAHAG